MRLMGGSLENGSAWGIKKCIGSLRRFKNLRRLEIPWMVLFAWSTSCDKNLEDVLPIGIRDLLLRDDLDSFWTYEWTQEVCGLQVEALLRQENCRLRQLRCITIELSEWTSLTYWDSDAWHWLQQAFQQTGIDLKFYDP